jgi:predicted DNA-binding transcriptional regulator AlpA
MARQPTGRPNGRPRLSAQELLLRGSPRAKHRAEQERQEQQAAQTVFGWYPPEGVTMDNIADYGLLTVDELADLLKVSPSTVHAMRRDRRIPPPIELSFKNLRWSKLMIQDWIRDGCPAPIAVDAIQDADGSTQDKGDNNV